MTETQTDKGKKLFVNKPGGVIVHLKDGSQRHLKYGEPVPHDELADHQRAYIGRHADEQSRGITPEQSQLEGRVADAHRASVMSNLGQPNSSADVVPADYGQLDEDGAIALVRALEGYPEAQAQVVLHERINYGRQRVIDAAGDQARESASALLDQLHDQVVAQHAVAADLHEGTREQPDNDSQSAGKPLEDQTKAQLQRQARERDLDDSGTKEQLVERLREANADPGQQGGQQGGQQTPPPNTA